MLCMRNNKNNQVIDCRKKYIAIALNVNLIVNDLDVSLAGAIKLLIQVSLYRGNIQLAL